MPRLNWDREGRQRPVRETTEPEERAGGPSVATMRARLAQWGYLGPALSDADARRLWDEAASLPPLVRRLRVDPATYPEYRRSIEEQSFDFAISLRAIERIGEAGARHIETAIASAERIVATAHAERQRRIRQSELKLDHRHEVLDRLHDQQLRLLELLRREVVKRR